MSIEQSPSASTSVVSVVCVGSLGKILDSKYLEKRRDNELWSKVEFPVKKSLNKDFQLWKTALRSVIPVDGVQDKLGTWLHQGYNIWDWRYDI